MSCKFEFASSRSNSSTRKYASELAPQRPFDASRSCSSTRAVDRPPRHENKMRTFRQEVKPLHLEDLSEANTIDHSFSLPNLDRFRVGQLLRISNCGGVVVECPFNSQAYDMAVVADLIEPIVWHG